MAATLRGAADAAPKIALGNFLFFAYAPALDWPQRYLAAVVTHIRWHQLTGGRDESEAQSGAQRRAEEHPGRP
jgi:hypothetical protein